MEVEDLSVVPNQKGFAVLDSNGNLLKVCGVVIKLNKVYVCLGIRRIGANT